MDRLPGRVIPKKYSRVLLVFALLFLAYYGLPLAFLKAPVQDHLENKYGVHVDVGSVRISIRGLVVTDVTAVWPQRGATLEIKEIVLSPSPLKSLAQSRIVLERLKFTYPTVTIRLPETPGAPQDAPPGVTEPSGSASPTPQVPMSPTSAGPRLPANFHLTVRRGKIHVMRGDLSVLIHPFEAELSRDAPERLVGWMKLDSRELGNIEISYEQGRTLHLEADAVSLASLTGMMGSPQKLYGQLSMAVQKTGDRASGHVKLEGLIWTGPNPKAPKSAQIADTPAGIELSDTQSLPAETDSVAVYDTVPAVPQEEIQFIYPPLDAQCRWSGRWTTPTFALEDAGVDVAGIPVQASGAVSWNADTPLEADLNFYAASFNEPDLERISRHFHVLRYLHAFLKTIESPSRLQAKMHLKGPLTRPVDWRYEGLVDIRRDTFSYEPFLGQYSFLGTVEFNQYGVTVPEILMPFGQAGLVLSGTAAEYATRTARLELKGRGLEIGPMIHYYTGGLIDPPDTHAESLPSGLADVNLALTRFGSAWNLNGDVRLKQISIKPRAAIAPARAFGRIQFSGDRADGLVSFRSGSFEFALSPYAHGLFTPAAEYGVFLKQNAIRWGNLAKSLNDPGSIPFLPTAGTGDVSIKIHSEEGGAGWRMDGTADVHGARCYLPPFSSPLDSAAVFIAVEQNRVLIQRAAGVLAGVPISATGSNSADRPRFWSLKFQTPDLDLAALLSRIRPARQRGEVTPFEISADVSADKFRFHGFEIPAVAGSFKIEPGQFTVNVDTPIPTAYLLTGRDRPHSEISFAAAQPYPLKNLFAPAASIGGNISGKVTLKGPNFSDSKTLSGEMELDFDRLAFKKTPPLLQLLDLMSLSFNDAIVFEPFRFHSTVENGTVKLDMDRASNVGQWKIRGRLGLDAAYMPLTASDSAFHVTFYPRENILTKILNESKILNILGGKREGIKLDFDLFGNYNKTNILWTEEPFVSVIRGRVSELVPGFFAAPSPSDTDRAPSRDAQSPAELRPDSP